jgi:hypothetical protein
MFKPTVFAFLLTAALAAAPLSAPAQTTPPSAPAVVAPPPNTKVTNNVSGKIEARSDSTLTVSGRTVSISSSTTCSKSGASIGSSDLKVGDKVNIVTSDDGQVAVSIDVISSD